MSVNNETYVRIDFITKDGKHDWEKKDEESAQEFIDKVSSDGGTAEIKFTQTFGVHEVSSDNPLQDLADLVPNVQEQANLINRSLRIKEMKYVSDAFKNDTFTPVEGVFDLVEVCASVSERKAADPATKAANAISKLAGRAISTEELMAIINAMNAGSGVSA